MDDDGSPGGDDRSPGGDDRSPGGDDRSPGGDDVSSGADADSPERDGGSSDGDADSPERDGGSSDGDADSPDSGLVDEIARGGGLGFLGRLGGKGLSVLVQVLMTRYLGPTRYGLFVLGQSVARIGQRLAQLGLDQGVLRYGSVYEGDDRRLGGLVGTTLVVSLLGSAVVAVAVYAFAGSIATVVFDDPALEPVVRAFVLAIPFYVLFELVGAYFQAFRRIGTQQLLTSVFRQVANLVLVGGAFLLGFRLYGAIGGFVLTSVLGTLVGGYLLFAAPSAPLSVGQVGGALDERREVLSFSAQMMVVAMSFLLATRMDRIMLGILSTTESVGVYNVAAMVAFQFSIVLSSLISIFKPVIADVSDAGDTERVRELYETVAKWATFGTVPPYVVVVLFATPVLSVFGSAFTAARPVLYVLPLMYLVGCVTGPCGALLSMSGRQRLEVGNQTVLVVLNAVLNLLLIPVYGAVGAAAAVVLAGAVTNALQLGFVYAIYGFHPFHREHLLLTIATAAVVALAVGIAVSVGLYGRLAAAAVLVGGWGLLFYRQVDDAERDLFRRVVS